MIDLDDYLINLPHEVSVGFNLTTHNGDVVKNKGTLSITEPPACEISYLADTLTHPEQIDADADCLVFIETGEIATLVCNITDISSKGLIRIKVRELIQHSDKRKYFRGPAGRLSIYCCQKKEVKDTSNELEFFKVGGINISCGGLLMALDRPLAKKDLLALDIQTPEPSKSVISCHGVVVRVSKFQDSYFVAVKFTDLESSMCDDIMAFCFAEQRRMLRELVIPKDL